MFALRALYRKKKKKKVPLGGEVALRRILGFSGLAKLESDARRRKNRFDFRFFIKQIAPVDDSVGGSCRLQWSRGGLPTQKFPRDEALARAAAAGLERGRLDGFFTAFQHGPWAR